MNDRIGLEAPLDGAFGPVVRLIVAGIAERADLSFEDLDDFQLAIERLFAEAGSQGRVRLVFEVGPRRIRTRVGPLREASLAAAMQAPASAPGSLTLGRVLSTVVDSYGVEVSDEGDIVVRLEKLGGTT
jgi:hypothetical protein